jgi:hypothetical protein
MLELNSFKARGVTRTISSSSHEELATKNDGYGFVIFYVRAVAVAGLYVLL